MKPHTLPSNIPAAVLFWVMLSFFKLGWWLVRLLWQKSWSTLVAIILAGLFANQADAGWFSRKPDPAMEAANRALTQAAETANEAARIQGEQNIRIAEAITQLSGERAQLAGHLESLREFAARDSAWAAALSAVGPVLVVAMVIAVGGVALWLVTRSDPANAELVDVLLDEVTSENPRWLAETASRPLLQEDLEERALLLAADEDEPDIEHDAIPNTAEEYPF